MEERIKAALAEAEAYLKDAEHHLREELPVVRLSRYLDQIKASIDSVHYARLYFEEPPPSDPEVKICPIKHPQCPYKGKP